MAWQFLKNAVAATYGGGLRSALEAFKGSLGIDGARSPAQSRVAFTIAVVALAAKMSKADGVSLPVEAQAFERQFSVPDTERAHVRRLYQLASQDVAGYEAYAAQVARLLEDQQDLKIRCSSVCFMSRAPTACCIPMKTAIWRTFRKFLDCRNASIAAFVAGSSSMRTVPTRS